MDREKVIKGLGIVSRMLNEMGRRNEMDIVDDALALLKEQELRVCCLCGYFDTVENRCKYHKHDVDVSEFCSRWVKRNDDMVEYSTQKKKQ